MRQPASNRQKKLLRFFGVRFGPQISAGAAGWDIDIIMSDPANRELWRRYLFHTGDFDTASESVVPVDRKQLLSLVVPEDWSASQAVSDFRAATAAKIVEDESPYDSPEPAIVFQDMIFMFTGKFAHGSREQCQADTIARGGKCPKQKSVSQNIDYLVIGTDGSSRWKRGAYGNKIEQAILARRDYGTPAIVSEAHWKAFL